MGMIQIAEWLPPEPGRLGTLMRQAGVEHAVGILPGVRPGAEPPWAFAPLLHLKKSYEDAGFTLAVIEASPPMDRIRLGAEGRDEEIEWFCTLLRNMGALGIPVICWNFMAVFNWTRTSMTARGRGGALVTRFDLSDVEQAPALDPVDEDHLWENLEYFLRRVVPVAEEAGVRLALHPDDPPLSPIRGVARIIRSLDALQRAAELVPSEYNGITFCQGNVALMTDDVPAAIRRFGERGRIHFVHFRDVRGDVTSFEETFHDEGQTDMLACMRAYRDIGFDGVLRSDHVPTLDGETVDIPGYGALGRLFAVGYITGLREAAYAQVAGQSRQS